MKIKSLCCAMVLLLICSCGKDDGAGEQSNQAPVIQTQEFEVREDIMDRHKIGSIVATDEEGDNLVFNIDTNDSGLFHLSADGILSLAKGKTLDYEISKEHKIKVSVTDGIEHVETQITIKVQDVTNTLAENPESFVTLWNITEENPEIAIGTNISNFNYNYTIDWGDGNIENKDHDGSITHMYDEIGTYKVAIIGQFPQIVMGREAIQYWDREALIGIEQWGSIMWEGFQSAFVGCSNLENHAKDFPNLEKVTSMSSMFASTKKFDGDLSKWDVSSVTNMQGMFFSATFRGDISKWDVSNVIDMSHMFSYSTFNGDIDNWDVGNVTDMYGMFFTCIGFNANIGGWDVGKVKKMGLMFFEAKTFNQNLGSWNLENVESIGNMLSHTNLSRENYEQTLIGWKNGINTPIGLNLGASGLNYCSNSDAAEARETLINEFGWTISGDVEVECN